MDKNIILLIGMPGCGKTIIGEIVSKKLGYKFCDMDTYIEEISKSTVKELFEKSEEYFRDFETRACMELSTVKEKIIISTGGGVVKRKENIDFFKEKGIIIFIDRSVEDIINDIDTNSRPLLKDGISKLYNLYSERYNLYKDYSQYKISNDKDIEKVINNIIKIINSNK